MRNNIVILTPTYNRPENLEKLFSTLLEQTRKDFQWMIVDDGSPSSYAEVVENIKSNADFEVKYFKKDNGGKSSAVNYALDRIESDSFMTIIDDDELLYPNAVETIQCYAEKYRNTDVGVINFMRKDMQGNVIARPVFDHDYKMDGGERVKKGYYSDGYVGYYTNHVGQKRFPVFADERYMGPSVLVMLVTTNCFILWSYQALGYTEYLEGGLTRQGRKLRLKNPKGMAVYSMLAQAQDCGFKNKIKYASSFFAYLFYANIGIASFRKAWEEYKIFCPIISKLLGLLIAKRWQHQFGNYEEIAYKQQRIQHGSQR